MSHKYNSEERISQFWAKVDRTGGDNSCWIWTACTNDAGYGQVGWGGRTLKAHRVSYFLANGPFPPELDVLHDCDNPSCVNPHHLFLGTNLDNVHDRDRKGRGNQARGENAGGSKLTDSQVSEIRARYESGEATQAQLTREFPVGSGQISRIVNYKSRTSPSPIKKPSA